MDAASALLELKQSFQSNDHIPTFADKGVQFDANEFKTTSYNSVVQLIRSGQELGSMTGLPSFDVLDALVKCVSVLEPNSKFNFPVKERIVLTLMRLKLDISFRCLAVLFQTSTSTCQNYFYNMVKKLAQVLKTVIRWPSKEEIIDNMPTCFKPYKKTRIVLDGTEIEVEKTKCLHCRIATYSHYKGKNTVKFLIGVSPSGLITYVSQAYGGRASDKAIFNQSDLLQKLIPYVDAVMVDKGFLIESECDNNGIEIIRPPFMRQKKQFSKEEADSTASIARARVHVERTIQRMKLFKLLSNKIPATFVSSLDNIAVIISGIVNLTPPILASDKYQ
jgi:hypothetical protein